MELAARASARLPFGVPDPVMGGAAAVALYTGGLWSVTALAMTTVDAGKLVAALFAVGFRASRGMGRADLWHPDCAIGIDIVSATAPGTPTEPADALTVTLDKNQCGPSTAATLQVVGIEDLIIEQARFGCWTARRVARMPRGCRRSWPWRGRAWAGRYARAICSAVWRGQPRARWRLRISRSAPKGRGLEGRAV